ncbi:unnamed protein product, partial [marine sediment metagenome]
PEAGPTTCGKEVELWISTGPPTVPNVVGDANQAAQDEINAVLGLSVGVITTDCNDAIAAGNVVSTDPAAGATTCDTTVDLVISTGPCAAAYPGCWDWLRQCYGDTVDNDELVQLADFFVFKDSYGKNYWDHYPADDEDIQPGEYHPCADYDRNGLVELADFFVFKDSYADKDVSGYSDCDPLGDPYGVYLPGSVKP